MFDFTLLTVYNCIQHSGDDSLESYVVARYKPITFPLHQPTCKEMRHLLSAGCSKWTKGILLNLRKLCDNVGLDSGVWGVRICRRRL